MDAISLEDLLREFQEVYEHRNFSILPRTEAIIILTADGEADGETESRVCFAAEIAKPNKALVVFNGVTEERSAAVKMMRRHGINKSRIKFQNCGPRGKANTLTQFQTIARDSLTSTLRRLAVVTSRYHIPRCRRTAGKWLDQQTQFTVCGPTDDHFFYDTFTRVIAEIDRIQKYVAKGDILRYPR